MELDRPNNQNNVEAAIWVEGYWRHQAIRELLGRHHGRLTTCDVSGVARELGVSKPTLHRLISLYKRFGSVQALLPKRAGRRRGTRVLSDDLEAIIRTTIEEACLARTWPTLTHLVEQVHVRCRESNLPLPHWQTVQSRLITVARREQAEGLSACECAQG